ncbi:tryptophan synthase subunit alpha [Fictibacillus nanhaiensis]|uniref:tryptophan synthase subunit alpha n=1 Tax=Fictibacillus nanhaiensis TaxID=742169 RepID=UPI001C94D8C6|nr:tryptophan synthase subunit alpha [Fictibacillus nanhaiensis]MBY6035700.1 tryptophan synthase subunit alpha [Fictibacillus nanhaiensis]
MNKRWESFQNSTQYRFVPYIMAGDPCEEATIELSLALQECGAAALELGVPYSDPLADGPVIQRAGMRGLGQNMTLEKTITLVSKLRERGLKIPVIIFTYYNLLLQLGENRFVTLAEENGVDGLLVPDLPYEESSYLREMCSNRHLALISLVAPTTHEDKLHKLSKEAQGFLYCISSLGVTGVRSEFRDGLSAFLHAARLNANVPVLVGFGLSSREQIQQFEETSDGFIVGSAIVNKIESLEKQLMSNREEAIMEFKHFIDSLLPVYSR